MKKVITNLVLVIAFLSVSNTNAQTAYITDGTNGNCYVIDLTTNTVAHVIAGVIGPVAVSANGTRVYVGNGSVQVLSTVTNTIIASIPVPGSNLYGITVSPNGSRVYAIDYANDLIYVINTAIDSVIYTIHLTAGSGPDEAIVSPDGSKLYVVNWGMLAVTVINTTTNTVSATIPVISSSQDIAISPDGSKVYISNYADASISVINTASNTVIATITTGSLSYPEGIVVSPDGSKVYVANGNLGTVSVISTAADTIIASIHVGGSPNGISVSPDGSRVVVNYLMMGNYATVINTLTNTVIANVLISSNYLGAFGNFITCAALSPVIIGDSTFCQDDSITLNPGVYSNYLWSNGNTTDSIYINASGTYYVTVTNNNNGGCKGIDSLVVTAVNCTGINEINDNHSISIFPNPASTILSIHHTTYTANEAFLITDLLGNEVYKEMLTGIDNTIAISKLGEGLYFYEVRGERESVRGKFVVQK